MASSPPPSLDDASVLSPPPQRRRPVGSLLFRSPEPANPTSPPDQPQPQAQAQETSPQDGAPAESSPSVSGEPPDEPPASPEATSWTASSTEDTPAPPSPLGKAATRRVTRAAVQVAGTTAHRHLTRDEIARDELVWIVDDEDAHAIGDPLGNLLARRGGIAGSMANPDIADLVNLMVGAANYASKQLERLARARERRRAGRIEKARTEPWPSEAAADVEGSR